MSQASATELALVETPSHPAPAAKIAPQPSPTPSSPKAALRRCSAAYQRAFKAYMDESDPDNDMEEVFAAHEGHKAYRKAMPMLAGYEGVRDFIACAAHGILIGALLPESTGQLLYAAQVALNALQFEPKPPSK
jgi:hypothetical protein